MNSLVPDDRAFEEMLASRLAVLEVPPVPDELDLRVRERLNRVLLTTHLIDFAIGAVPRTIVTLLNPVLHLIGITLTGRRRRSPDTEEAPEEPDGN